MDELTTSRIEGNKFYLGQTELSFIVKRIIKHYQYRHNNESPEAVVIPSLDEVEGVPIIYPLIETLVVLEEVGPEATLGRVQADNPVDESLDGLHCLAAKQHLDAASKAVETAAKAKKKEVHLKPEEA